MVASCLVLYWRQACLHWLALHYRTYLQCRYTSQQVRKRGNLRYMTLLDTSSGPYPNTSVGKTLGTTDVS